MRNRLFAALIVPFCAILLLCGRAHATFVRAMGLDEMIDVSDLVFNGTVESVEARWNSDKTGVFTFVTFKDLDILKGGIEGGAKTYTVRIDGGDIPGQISQEQVGAPTFRKGERRLLFLSGNLTRTCPIVGVRQGSFQVVRDTASGEDLLYRDEDEVLDLSGPEPVFRPRGEPSRPGYFPGEEDDSKAKAARLRGEGEERKRASALRERPKRRAEDLVQELRSSIQKRGREGRFSPPRPAKSGDQRKDLAPLR